MKHLTIYSGTKFKKNKKYKTITTLFKKIKHLYSNLALNN